MQHVLEVSQFERGWIESDWGLSELNRRVKLYRLTAAGVRQLEVETANWKQLHRAVISLFRAAWWDEPLDFVEDDYQLDVCIDILRNGHEPTKVLIEGHGDVKVRSWRRS